ncbi:MULTISPECIES: iron-containing alcohol dehydrogenase [Rhizobium/Agrobacterium group]|uniref:iron-containing alcohol dehydrogenase n=1 Tax=Rhizobium/Agrobacterium group TaxID=227290 RepID=UPI0007160829|nr:MULTISPECIES: iron-containing alcohol dehydrogenase [Rhizobium/Agrobacterium group]KRA64312.1 alcohol dehydrogenase [Rhizobium sp. Root651]MDH1270857.1 iron-containing alcohol dehydrogenase [Agrobacterium pusense]
MNFNFLSTPRIVCQSGGLAQLGALAQGLSVTRALVISDPGIVACGFAAEAVAALIASGIAAEIFDQVQADPPIMVVEAAVEAARAFGADGVIGLGGGSSLDTAKVVAAAAASGQPVAEMIGIDRVVGCRLPLIQVPTTAGTGSEVTWVSVLTSESHEKKAVYAPQLLPDIALLDPKLTLGMPRSITAATALDAMVHAIEAATSRTRKNPISDGLADKALVLLGQNLPIVLDTPTDLAAREAMLLGATLAGMAFINASVGAIHALSYPLGTGFHVPHGHANALVAGPVLRFNMPAAETEYARLSRLLLPGRSFQSDTTAALGLIEEMERMLKASGLKTRLSEVGVTEAAIPAMAQEVVTGISRLLATNPRDMTADDVARLYREVL